MALSLNAMNHGADLWPLERHVASHANPDFSPWCHGLWCRDVLPHTPNLWSKDGVLMPRDINMIFLEKRLN